MAQAGAHVAALRRQCLEQSFLLGLVFARRQGGRQLACGRGCDQSSAGDTAPSTPSVAQSRLAQVASEAGAPAGVALRLGAPEVNPWVVSGSGADGAGVCALT